MLHVMPPRFTVSLAETLPPHTLDNLTDRKQQVDLTWARHEVNLFLKLAVVDGQLLVAGAGGCTTPQQHRHGTHTYCPSALVGK